MTKLTITEKAVLTLMPLIEADDWPASMGAIMLMPDALLDDLDAFTDDVLNDGENAEWVAHGTARHIARIVQDEKGMRDRRRYGGEDAIRIAAIKAEFQRRMKTGREYEAGLMAMGLTDADLDAVLKRYPLMTAKSNSDARDLLNRERLYRATAAGERAALPSGGAE